MNRLESLSEAKVISRALGKTWPLPPNATITKTRVEDLSVTVVLEVFDVTETVRETRYTKKGLRLLNWTRTTSEAYLPSSYDWKYTSMTVWDDDFVPYADHKVGRIESPAEYRARRLWEGEQYRVGTPNSPLDSAYRVTQGHTTEEMTRYWND